MGAARFLAVQYGEPSRPEPGQCCPADRRADLREGRQALEGRRRTIRVDREQQATETANRNARNNYTASTIMNTVFSDPSIWRDGPGAIGLAQYYGSNFGSVWDSIFNPQAAQP